MGKKQSKAARNIDWTTMTGDNMINEWKVDDERWRFFSVDGRLNKEEARITADHWIRCNPGFVFTGETEVREKKLNPNRERSKMIPYTIMKMKRTEKVSATSTSIFCLASRF